MPPKTAPTWKAWGRAAANPFRRSGSISRENSSKAPSITSVDRERSESPAPIDEPTAAPEASAPPPAPIPAPINTSNLLPLSNDGQGAVDLSSPIDIENKGSVPYTYTLDTAKGSQAAEQQAADVGSGQAPMPNKGETTAAPTNIADASKTNAAADQASDDVGSGQAPVRASGKPADASMNNADEPKTRGVIVAQESGDVTSGTEPKKREAIYIPNTSESLRDATQQESDDVGSGQEPTRAQSETIPVTMPVASSQVPSALKQDAEAPAKVPVADRESDDVGSGQGPTRAENGTTQVTMPIAPPRSVLRQDTSKGPVVDQESDDVSSGAQPVQAEKTVGFVEQPDIRVVPQADVYVVEQQPPAAVVTREPVEAIDVAPIPRPEERHEEVNPWAAPATEEPRREKQSEQAIRDQEQESEDVGGASELYKKPSAPPEYTSPYPPVPINEKGPAKDVTSASQSRDIPSEAPDTQAGPTSEEVPIPVFIAPGTVVSSRTANAEPSTSAAGQDHYTGTEESLRAVATSAAAGYIVGRAINPPSGTTDNAPTQRSLEPYAPLNDDVSGGVPEIYASTGDADPFADSQASVGPSQSQTPLVQTRFARPYAIHSVRPLSTVSQEQVAVDDDGSDGLLAVRPMNGFQEPLTASFVSHTPLTANMEISEWTVFALPNGAKYFVHPKARVVTDVDITHAATLKKVTKHLEEVTRTSTMHHQHHHHHHGRKQVDDATPLQTGTTSGGDWPGGFKRGGPRYGYGATSSGFTYWKADTHTHEQGRMMGLEIWLKSFKPGHENGYDVGGHTSSHERDSVTPVLMWVDHLSKTVSADAPWSKLGATSIKGGDDDAVEPHLRYWEYIQSHPAHILLPPGAAEEAIEALTWCYTELLLRTDEHDCQPNYAKTPFTLKESHDLLELIKNLDAQAAGPLQTNVIAKVHIRLAKHRQHTTIHHAEPTLMEPHHAPPSAPFKNIMVKGFITLFCLGIPYLYVPKEVGPHRPRVTASGYHEIEELEDRADGQHHPGPLADSPIVAASVALVASIFIASSIAFLALPGVEDASRLASLICLILSASSLGAGIINLRRRSVGARHAQKHTAPGHPFVRSLPLVFLLWAVIAMVTSAYLYVYRVSTTPGQHKDEILSDVLRWVIVGVGSALAFILLVSAVANRRRA
ncbi:hypothetical protein FRB93_008901 [Tulasnella sp. JGI-2019a]|nr:hypothetical protein FRB93_008901 [Tulasnella sp. JGI-2019a]